MLNIVVFMRYLLFVVVCKTLLLFCSGLTLWCLEWEATGAMCEDGRSYPSVRAASCAANAIPHLG